MLVIFSFYFNDLCFFLFIFFGQNFLLVVMYQKKIDDVVFVIYTILNNYCKGLQRGIISQIMYYSLKTGIRKPDGKDGKYRCAHTDYKPISKIGHKMFSF